MNTAISIMTLYKQKYNAVHTPSWEYKSPSLDQRYRATAVLWAFLIAYPSTNDNNATITTHRLASHVFLDGKVGDWTDASATDNLFHQYFRGCRAGLLPWRQIRRQKSSYEIADDVGVTRPRIYKSASVKLPCCLPEMILRSDPGGLSRLRLVVGSAEQPGPHSYPPTHRD